MNHIENLIKEFKEENKDLIEAIGPASDDIIYGCLDEFKDKLQNISDAVKPE